ncbi:MAG: pantetheine-phosphate adenylyltransferase [Chitinophagales bacterium]|nr:pantetheine-phosphate adenylyltransferase [Chitinophagales bacterium]
MSQKIAVFPGSFDPITNGHVNIVKRALPLFDKIIIAIGNNSTKKYAFSFEKREQWIKDIFKKHKNIEVMGYQGLTVTFVKSVNATYLLRGIRNSSDFEYEKTIAQLNKTMAPELETICMLTDPLYAHISSTIVREIILNGGDPNMFVPKEVKL